MHSDDALVYPERFTKGFSFGLKVKLPDSVKDYTTPRYILDSGAKSLSSRGVSLYLLEKRLVCEIASSDFMWKVGLITLTGMIVFVIVHFLLYCTEYFYILLNIHIALRRITSHHIASHHINSHRITSHRIASHHITSHCLINLYKYCFHSSDRDRHQRKH